MRTLAFILSAVALVLSAQMLPHGGITVRAAQAGYRFTDSATQGGWVGVYGADGGDVANEASPITPAYVTITKTGFSVSTGYTPNDARAPFFVSNHSLRSTSVWFNSVGTNPLIVQFQFSDSTLHGVPCYFLSDGQTRNITIQFLDAANGDAVLDTKTLNNASSGDPSGFQLNPVWYFYNMTGNKKIKVIKNTGPNPVMMAFLFGNSTLTYRMRGIPIFAHLQLLQPPATPLANLVTEIR